MDREVTGCPLNHSCLSPSQLADYERLKDEPITVLQVGEGNFLRGFFDWMIHEVRRKGLYQGGIAVTQPRPGGSAKLQTLRRQDGLFTLVMRGMENGERVERKELVSVFAEMIDPYKEWEKFLALADNPHLQFVVSNTTEAGLAYHAEPLVDGQPVMSFPGKMALFLYRRFQVFQGRADKGLIFLPCELLENNGDELRGCVVRYCEAWGLPDDFIQWIIRRCRFLNSLVDRIVTGYPEAEAERWFAEWGYRDELLTTAEPYHLWVIEAEPELGERLPFRKAGLQVEWVQELAPFRLRKVRLLNGAHTLMAPLGILLGIRHVREAMEDKELGQFIRSAVEEEIIPSVPLPSEELQDYAGRLYERFLNPFIDHRLADIALNSVSKFKVRLLPALLYYAQNGKPLPARITRSLAALLRFYKVIKTEEGYQGMTLKGAVYTVKDDPSVLEAFQSIWNEDDLVPEQRAKRLLAMKELGGPELAAVQGLPEAIAACWREMGMVS